jgi:elongation factor G
MGEAPHVLEIAVEPKDSVHSGLDKALREFAVRNPDIGVAVDSESGSHLLRAAGEDDLDAAIASLREFLPFAVKVGAPQVVYRETLSRPATARYTHKKVLSSTGQFADVMLAFEPLPSGSGVVFESGITHMPVEYVFAIEKGVRAQAASGLLAGFPVTDFSARLVGGNYHEMDSSPLAFDIAARAAFLELAAKDVALLLEPVMRVEVVTPEDFLGGVTGDLILRRGRVDGTEPFGEGLQVIAAMVPLSCLLGYGTTLAAMTQGKGNYKATFGRYELVPIDGGDDTFPSAVALRA